MMRGMNHAPAAACGPRTKSWWIAEQILSGLQLDFRVAFGAFVWRWVLSLWLIKPILFSVLG